ncbi:MAG: hypothetical protein QGG40_15265, partial [Myxococcota bacterium]|nr:hypothetical protein [Myxococcota bacterium]
DHDSANPDEARLFTEVTLQETPTTNRDAMVAQVQVLHLRVFGNRVAADGPEVEANLELWEMLYQSDLAPPNAWAGLLSALFRDPDFIIY